MQIRVSSSRLFCFEVSTLDCTVSIGAFVQYLLASSTYGKGFLFPTATTIHNPAVLKCLLVCEGDTMKCELIKYFKCQC